jgi:hypothetical protein
MTEFTDADRDAWGHAITLEDLGELTARWLDGTIGYNPGYGGDPDPETGPVVEALAAINRRGFVTTFSQPGVPLDDEGHAQRASVEGYAREATARRLGTLALRTDLLLHAFPPGNYEAGYQVPVTIEAFRPFTWVGAYYGKTELEHYAQDLSREALAELSEAWTVSIIDPSWGRLGYLWEYVIAVMEDRDPDTRFSVEPYNTELDSDFGV